MKKNKKAAPTLKKVNKKVLSIGILSVLLVVVVVIFFVIKNDQSNAIEYDDTAVDYQTSIAKPEGISGNSITFPGFKDTMIEEGSDKLYLMLVNPEFNQGNIQFTVFLDDEKKPILETKLVKPGKAITEIPLTKKLVSGTHTIRLEMLGYADDEQKTRLSGTTTTFELNVVKKGDE